MGGRDEDGARVLSGSDAVTASAEVVELSAARKRPIGAAAATDEAWSAPKRRRGDAPHEAHELCAAAPAPGADAAPAANVAIAIAVEAKADGVATVTVGGDADLRGA